MILEPIIRIDMSETDYIWKLSNGKWEGRIEWYDIEIRATGTSKDCVKSYLNSKAEDLSLPKPSVFY